MKRETEEIDALTSNKFYERTSKTPSFALLMRTDKGDFIWHDTHWVRTQVILDYMFGHNDWVDDITEEEARERFPKAFG
jgi:hypothetical protein